MNEFFKYLLGVTTATVVILLVAVYIGLDLVTKARVFVSDIIGFFGWLGKGVRKKSVSMELEGTLNGVVKEFNKNFSKPILANCKVEWITDENQSSQMVDGKAIICLSFNKKDHDLNFYNATYTFIQTALLSKTKPFIKQSTKKAIDLLSTKLILKNYRREVLSKFNSKFSEVEAEVKETYFRLDETEQSGLFNNFLIPEFHYVGEVLFDKTPSLSIENEIEGFVNWFYDLATRELDENSVLSIETPNFKIGVILVAKLTTYERFGTQAYVNRAEKYASDNFNAIYLLSKGKKRNHITEEIAEILTSTRGFEQINRRTINKVINEDANPVMITCICLRPDPASIRYNAWQFLKKMYEEKNNVIGIVEDVDQDHIVVNVAGLKIRINGKDLSELDLPDASRIFREDQELELVIKECDINLEKVWLSNIGTATDPKLLIEQNVDDKKIVNATVFKIRRDKDNLDKGIVVKCVKPAISVFVPRSKCTFSRFVDISEKFLINEKVDIVIEKFDFNYGNYIGRISDLADPWELSILDKLHINAEVIVFVKEIREKYITCEIQEGLECKLYFNEISWRQSECVTDNFKIDQKLTTRIIRIDRENKHISVSIKQLTNSPTKEFFNDNSDRDFIGQVIAIDNTKGINFKCDNPRLTGFIHWTEVIWGRLYPLNENFTKDDSILFRAIEYRAEYDNIRYSCKRCLVHEFEDFLNAFENDTLVEGKIIKVYKQIATVEVNYNGVIVQAFIHKSEVSNCCFVDDLTLPMYLQRDFIYGFAVKEIISEYSTVELSRKVYLNEVKDTIRLGRTYNVYVTKFERGRTYFYSDDIEGWISKELTRFKIGEEMEVMPVGSASVEFELVE